MPSPLVAKQLDSYRQATARTNIWEGSVRSSKTVSSLLAWLQFTRHGPPGNLLMVGRTERTLRRNVIDPLVEWLGDKRCRYVAGAGELHLLGRKVYIAGANDETSQEKIRGLTLVGAYVDEVSTVPESFWTMLMSRLSIAGARVFGTTNPDSPGHWLKRDWLDRAGLHLTGNGTLHHRSDEDALDLARFSFRLADNPHLPQDYLASLEREFVGLWHRRLILGEWVIAEGAIYDMFDPERHVVAQLPQLVRIVATGIDYGTRNPFHAVQLAQATDGRLVVTREYRHDPSTARRQKTDAEFAQALSAWHQGNQPGWTVVDPSAASFKLQLHQDGHPGVRDARNEVVDGIRLVSSLLARDQLVIHESCQGLLDELPGYSWDDKAAEKGEDKPIKVQDHGCDALRYAIATTRHIWQPHLKRPLQEATP